MNEPAQAEGAERHPDGPPRPPHAVVPRRAREAYDTVYGVAWCLAQLGRWWVGREHGRDTPP